MQGIVAFVGVDFDNPRSDYQSRSRSNYPVLMECAIRTTCWDPETVGTTVRLRFVRHDCNSAIGAHTRLAISDTGILKHKYFIQVNLAIWNPVFESASLTLSR